MINSSINWNRVTMTLLFIILFAFIIGTVWVFVDIWLPYQMSRKNTERIKDYIEKYKLYELDPSLRELEP